jgi:hypothetical protein
MDDIEMDKSFIYYIVFLLNLFICLLENHSQFKNSNFDYFQGKILLLIYSKGK